MVLKGGPSAKWNASPNRLCQVKHTHQNMGEENHEKVRPRVVIDYSRFRNVARAPPMSGHFEPKKFSPGEVDESQLLSTAEFRKKYIKNQPGNVYTDTGDVVEVPGPVRAVTPVSLHSPQTPVTALSGSTQRSETESSLGGSTYREEEDRAPSSWFAHRVTVLNHSGVFDFVKKNGRKRGAEHLEKPSNGFPKKKRVRRSLSWRSWYGPL